MFLRNSTTVTKATTTKVTEARMQSVVDGRAVPPKNQAHVFPVVTAHSPGSWSTDRLVDFAYSVTAYRTGPSKDSMLGKTY